MCHSHILGRLVRYQWCTTGLYHARMLTPFAQLASLASLTVRAPVEFFLFSNQAISCLSMALKVMERRVYISRSPDRVKHIT